MGKNKCRVEFTERGLEISGSCAQGFSELFEAIFEASKAVKREISTYACVDPETGTIKKVVLGKVGTPSSTSLPYDRVCLDNERQVSLHTHPVSGEAKFSGRDAITITYRMNEGIDDGSCVVGEEATQCFLRTLIPKKKE